MVKILRDGKEQIQVANFDTAFVWLMEHQPHSTYWAMKYDGWGVVDERTGKTLDGGEWRRQRSRQLRRAKLEKTTK